MFDPNEQQTDDYEDDYFEEDNPQSDQNGHDSYEYPDLTEDSDYDDMESTND